MFNGQLEARELEWGCAAPEPRTARVLSIEDMRQRLGLPLPLERREERTVAVSYERPRIVRRGGALLAVE
jgi:hypothetical protein